MKDVICETIMDNKMGKMIFFYLSFYLLFYSSFINFDFFFFINILNTKFLLKHNYQRSIIQRTYRIVADEVTSKQLIFLLFFLSLGFVWSGMVLCEGGSIGRLLYK